MGISRRGFFGLGAGIGADLATGGNVTKSALEAMADLALPGEAEAALQIGQQKGIEYLTQEHAVYDINRALQKVKGGRSQKGYEEAFVHFSSIYDKSMARFENTKDQFFLKTAVVGAMYAGWSMIDASSLNNGKKKTNLEMGLFMYGQALAARQKLGGAKHSVYKRNLIDLPVADEKLIRERAVEAYEALIPISSGKEKTTYLRSLVETYKRLVQLTDGTERINYRNRVQDISLQLGKR